MYTAIIIEPRKHPALSLVLNNFLENLSDQWKIIIFHGNLNIYFINIIINNTLQKFKHRISLINLNVDNLTLNDYNKLFIKNKKFYEYIPTDIFLVFQTDSMILKENKDLINKFLKYDYVGAPWDHMPKNNENVGNGGLSLRKKSKMLEIINNDIDTNYPEDVYFSCSNIVPLYKPSIEEAKLFSIECIFSNISFGCHKPWININFKEICELYPDVINLYILNNIFNNNIFNNNKIISNYKYLLIHV